MGTMIKKTKRVFFTDLKKIISDKYFWLAVSFIFLLFLTGTVYIDQTTGKRYTAITAITELNEQERLAEPFYLSREGIMTHCFSYSDVGMYAPILIMMPLIHTLVSERKKGILRYILTRTGKISYVLGKMLSTVTIGGITLCAGFMPYVIYIFTFYYSVDDVGGLEGGLFRIDFFFFLSCFLYGAMFAVLGYIVTIFSNNIYMFYCVPFMLHYLWTILAAHLKSKKIYPEVFDTISISSFLTLFYNDKKQQVMIIGVWGCIICICMGILFYRFERKIDCGA